jgi:hypothetical protein
LINVKPITAQEKFNFPRANAVLAGAQASLLVQHPKKNLSEILHEFYEETGSAVNAK